MRHLLHVLLLAFGLVHGQGGYAASCSASNEVGDTCSIDCLAGESAQCSNGTGAQTPRCTCSGSSGILPSRSWVLAVPTVATSSSGHSVAQTNAEQILNQKLASLRDYHLGNSCTDVKVGSECYGCDPCIVSTPAPLSILPKEIEPLRLCGPCICVPITERRCQKVVGKLALSGALDVEAGPTVKFEEPNWKDIPTEAKGLKATYKWCNPRDTKEIFTHAVREQVGAKVTKSRVVNTGKEITASVNASFSPGTVSGVGGGVSAGVKFSNSISVSSGEEQDFRKEESFSRTFEVPVPAMYETVVVHYWIKRLVPLKYSGTVQVNGKVVQNQEGVQLVSQVLPSVADRTFDFAGEVLDVSLYEGRAESYSRKLSEDECKAPDKDVFVKFELLK